jgi:hypothetical protein
VTCFALSNLALIGKVTPKFGDYRTRRANMLGIRIARAVFLLLIGVLASHQAFAGTPVDPSTLNPPPPPEFNPVCERVGANIICEVHFSDPPFAGSSDVVCGGDANSFEPLDYHTRSVRGKRYYDQNGNLLRRHSREYINGTIVNPLNHKALAYSGSDTVMHDLGTPGQIDTGTQAVTGSVRIFLGEGNGTFALDTGRYVDSSQGILFESGQHPFFDYFGGDTTALQPLCDALQ